MNTITGDWLSELKDEFSKSYFKELYKFIEKEYEEHIVYPKAENIFKAFNFTPLKEVKVVILGQDPYHNEGQAHGLSFSVQKGITTPPSLVNIYKELESDLEC